MGSKKIYYLLERQIRFLLIKKNKNGEEKKKIKFAGLPSTIFSHFAKVNLVLKIVRIFFLSFASSVSYLSMSLFNLMFSANVAFNLTFRSFISRFSATVGFLVWAGLLISIAGLVVYTKRLDLMGVLGLVIELTFVSVFLSLVDSACCWSRNLGSIHGIYSLNSGPKTSLGCSC